MYLSSSSNLSSIQSRVGNQVREGGSGLNPGWSQKLPRNKTGQRQATCDIARQSQNQRSWKRTLRSASPTVSSQGKVVPYNQSNLISVPVHCFSSSCCTQLWRTQLHSLRGPRSCYQVPRVFSSPGSTSPVPSASSHEAHPPGPNHLSIPPPNSLI